MIHGATHEVIDNASELVYGLPSGALNESHADTMAAFADGIVNFSDLSRMRAGFLKVPGPGAAPPSP